MLAPLAEGMPLRRLHPSSLSARVFTGARALRAGLGVSAAVLLAAQFVLLDVSLRGSTELSVRLVVSRVEAVVVWALALAFASTGARRAAFALVASALLVTQALVFSYYHAPIDVQLVQSALHAIHDVRPVVLRVLPAWVAAVTLVALAQFALAGMAFRALEGRWDLERRVRRPLLALGTLVGLFGLPPRSATPDVRLAHALVRGPTAGGAAAQGGPRASVRLPLLISERPRLPNVLFILTESVRAADYVVEGPLATARETARVTGGRADLRELRSVASYTALSLSSLVTGLSQEGARDAVTRAPTFFDYAQALRGGRGERPLVGYFSAQSATVFESADVRSSVDRFVTVETLRGKDVDDDAEYVELPLDRDLVDHFVTALPTLARPAVLMLHLVGTHAPYFVDPAHAPFTPFAHVVTWSGMPELHNAYRDAIVSQDRHVARAVRAFVEHVGSEPWMIVFTSDHGEAFGEHGAIHHGQNLFDEQTHVPGFVAWGNGALDPDEERALRDHGDRFVTHLDLLPTMLDALGIWENFAVAPHRAAMRGRSVLRPWEARGAIPVTNCTGMFPCPVNTWGMYDDEHAIVARPWDASWTCLDRRRPHGPNDDHVATAPDAVCARLQSTSRSFFPLLPNGTANR